MAEINTQILSSFIDKAPRTETPQQRFDAHYITTQEIMEMVDVTRPTVIAKLKHRFPTIKIGNTFFWERTDEILNYLRAWDLLRQQGE
tara:strand:- start:17633 stop:17896 length:264 start_codon:yes stop_codon:yes gene_type:complete